MRSMPTLVNQLVRLGALFVCSHSGGKDSQAQLIYLRQIVPADQLLIIHARLDQVEWDGTEEKVKQYAGQTPVIICEAVKTFFDMVRRRRRWPSPATRQCTSDLKRGPIDREIRRYLKAHPEFGDRVVMCMGLRSQESASRSKLQTFKRNERNSKAGRNWYEWLPIHDLSEREVFNLIWLAGQEPHWAYAAGMSRLSCSFCIMSSKADLQTAARLRPQLFETYCQLERELNHTFTMPQAGRQVFLPDLVSQEN